MRTLSDACDDLRAASRDLRDETLKTWPGRTVYAFLLWTLNMLAAGILWLQKHV